ncbi:3-phosphoshikimate 1-carboxyvinyltransferase [Bacillus taeanensis]|uniref:3-phosphoshikimate 1-carboxyvinyltransferase n=1 Tax=Bacillus taeanensis TaxID=273032 RepID=A0A366XVU0_9BACI|nr:3-phosphoshikimate 1-carboxyvinyltransferase [Bacillus taeanensis]RBW70272.1 3-phosphoshikimate 1-carboxyvinyltransferase [Bacillus taeanensis]
MLTRMLSPLQKPLKGELKVPGDKSISHRAVMFGAIAEGTTTVSGFLEGQDCLSTIACFKKLGITIERKNDEVKIEGKGFNGLQEPTEILDVGNSGTTTRLMMGILASSPFHSVVIGDESIARRPMDRVTNPLREMGAHIDGRENGRLTPISVRGGKTHAIDYISPVASAQVKSSILLAGLQSEGTTSVTEPHISRDHTERMLESFGVSLTREGTKVSLEGGQSLKGTHIQVPADISSAAFFLAAAAITPGSDVLLKDVGINPTRTGIIDVLLEMGADLSVENERSFNQEPVADLRIKHSNLKGIEIGGEIIPRLIDEIPIIALLATQAEGKMVIKDAEELKVKETNRIDAVVEQLQKIGASIEGTDDGMVIHGKSTLHGAEVDSLGDHRIGMTLAVASCIANGEIRLKREEAIAVSYPSFFEDLALLQN